MKISDKAYRALGRGAIFLGAALAVSFACFYYFNYCPCHYKHDKNCIEADGWVCSFLGNPEAVVGSFILLCNVILFYYISVQVRQGNAGIVLTREANAETKRSVDAYVAAERGRMNFVRFDMHPSGATYVAVFRNIGRTAATVRAFKVTFNDNPTPYIPGGFEEFIRPGKKFYGGFHEKARDVAFYPVPPHIMDMVRAKRPVTIGLHVLYEAFGGAFFELNHAFTMELKDGVYSAGGAVTMDVPFGREFAAGLLYDFKGMAYLERLDAERKEWDAKQGAQS
ncbi:MAG: hypothetical protein IPF41_04515 [Flavobacteriales bacterium]|nr:hypothetical protein [Flavobacteriales bacterium]